MEQQKPSVAPLMDVWHEYPLGHNFLEFVVEHPTAESLEPLNTIFPDGHCPKLGIEGFVVVVAKDAVVAVVVAVVAVNRLQKIMHYFE